jgi:ATP-dependent DNA helicase RecG
MPASTSKKSSKSGSSAADLVAKLQVAQDRLGLTDPRHALLCMPAAYSDCRTPARCIAAHDDVDRVLYALKIAGPMRGYGQVGGKSALVADLGEVGFRPDLVRSITRLEVDLLDEAGQSMTWTIFGNPWLARNFEPGQRIVLVGRVKWFGFRERRAYLEDVIQPPAYAVGRVWVKYEGISGRVAGDLVELLVRRQLDNPEAWRVCAARIQGELGRDAAAVLEASGGVDMGFASLEGLLRALHAPQDMDQAWMARELCHRLAAMSVEAAALRHHVRPPHPQAPLPISDVVLDSLKRSQPETLSAEQLAAIDGIAAALASPQPLTGLLSGDVGTGKTLAYLIPAIAAHRAGARVAIIAPTDLLANQIASQAQLRFAAQATVHRIKAGRKIADPLAILVGTPGLVSVARRYGYEPQVLVCDEQHKLSTEIREALIRPFTHVLEVTATPVPRSLATVVYGGMKVFNLRHCPVQKQINSLVYDVGLRPKAVAAIDWAIKTGQKAAVIYPRVESTSGDAMSVTQAAQVFEQVYPGKVAMLHGGMTEAEKTVAMEQIRSGERPIVVGSTVMETGIDIPSIAVMVVRDADRFGISQLHQLRGRLARNGGVGWFFMLVEERAALPAATLARLETVASTTDGYELAEQDLAQRGFGDLDGTQQSGAADAVFKLVKLSPENFLRLGKHRPGQNEGEDFDAMCESVSSAPRG